MSAATLPIRVSVKPYGWAKKFLRHRSSSVRGYRVMVDGKIAAAFDIADYDNEPLTAVCRAYEYAERRRQRRK